MFPKGEIALRYARAGFKVFPLRPDNPNESPAEIKKPALHGDWKEHATTDEAEIRKWWTRQDYNIAIATLPGDDLVILDYDMKDGQNGAVALRTHELLDIPESFRVRTASGGLHIYFRVPPGVSVANSVSKIAKHVDVRGNERGGYVVGPGSTIHGKPYVPVREDCTRDLLSDWLLKLATANRRSLKAGQGDTVGDIDTQPAIDRAVAYLTDAAPEAIEGAGGNNTTFKVACHIRDFGLSQPTVRDLMLEHWNATKAAPPWPADELDTITRNAFNYASLPAGIANPANEFEAVDLGEPKTWPQPTEFKPFDPAKLPRRRWIVKDFLARTFVSGLVSPGGMGKTQLVASACLAIASGSDKPLGLKIIEHTKVWYWNQEDDSDELTRRFAAAMKHNNMSWSDLKTQAGEPTLYLDSGVDQPLILAKRNAAGAVIPNRKVADEIVAQIRARQIGVFIFDPLIEFHEAEENNNVEMRAVMAVARRIAVEGECAVLAVAHTRKPPASSSDSFAGDIDSLRGAGAQTNVMRLGFTLYSMSEKDAKRWGVPERDRHLHVRLDTGKANITLSDGKPKWFRRVSVMLGEFEDHETVGVLEPVALKERVAVEDGLGLLAKTIAAGASAGTFEFDKPCRLNDLLDAMGAAEQAVFGDARNRSRELKKMLSGPGVQEAGGKAVADTPFGRLSIYIKERAPTLIVLNPLSTKNATKDDTKNNAPEFNEK